ncbi:MAG: hypothetical protein AB7S71_18255 [Dongiaceae bacterium]
MATKRSTTKALKAKAVRAVAETPTPSSCSVGDLYVRCRDLRGAVERVRSMKDPNRGEIDRLVMNACLDRTEALELDASYMDARSARGALWQLVLAFVLVRQMVPEAEGKKFRRIGRLLRSVQDYIIRTDATDGDLEVGTLLSVPDWRWLLNDIKKYGVRRCEAAEKGGAS